MKSKKGFTLIELMAVILIVGILAAVAVPLMRGRIDTAKWSEGKVIMGTIAVALCAYVAEKGSAFTPVPSLAELGFVDGDLDGTYFTGGESGGMGEGKGKGKGKDKGKGKASNFSWVINDDNPLDFLITTTAPKEISTPSKITLDANGNWTETP